MTVVSHILYVPPVRGEDVECTIEVPTAVSTVKQVCRTVTKIGHGVIIVMRCVWSLEFAAFIPPSWISQAHLPEPTCTLPCSQKLWLLQLQHAQFVLASNVVLRLQRNGGMATMVSSLRSTPAASENWRYAGSFLMCNACGIRWRRKHHVGSKRRRPGPRALPAARIHKRYHAIPPPPPLPPAPSCVTRVPLQRYTLPAPHSLGYETQDTIALNPVSSLSVDALCFRSELPTLSLPAPPPLTPLFRRSQPSDRELDVRSSSTNKTPKLSISSLLNDGPAPLTRAISYQWFFDVLP